MTKKQQQREYDAIKHLICALSIMCAGSPNKTIDLLTGFLWDVEESLELKKALVEGDIYGKVKRIFP